MMCLHNYKKGLVNFSFDLKYLAIPVPNLLQEAAHHLEYAAWHQQFKTGDDR